MRLVPLINMFTPAPLPQILRNDAVHIWYFNLDRINDQSILSADEKARADRLRIESKRQQFITTRHTTRIILSSYLQTSPELIQFTYNEHGKPFVDGLNFNLSHTDNHAVIAISTNYSVGIDIEQLRTVESYDFIRETAFTDEENKALDELAPEDRQLAFWRCWTRKEAAMKGIGIGFRIAKHLTVSLDNTPRIINNQTKNTDIWNLHEYRLEPDLLITMAVNSNTSEIQTLIYGF